LTVAPISVPAAEYLITSPAGTSKEENICCCCLPLGFFFFVALYYAAAGNLTDCGWSSGSDDEKLIQAMTKAYESKPPNSIAAALEPFSAIHLAVRFRDARRLLIWSD
jgi:hypothetical protein